VNKIDRRKLSIIDRNHIVEMKVVTKVDKRKLEEDNNFQN